MSNENNNKSNNDNYRKPPVETRFKKGQSGNPNGRRPKEPPEEFDPGKILQAIDNEKIVILVDGKRKVMKKAEVEIRACFKKAIDGDRDAARLVASMAAKYLRPEALGPQETEFLIVPDEPVSALDPTFEQQLSASDQSLSTTRRVKKPGAAKGKRRTDALVSMHSLFRKVAREKIAIEGQAGQVKMELLEAYFRKMQLLACSDVGAARLMNELRRLFPGPPTSGDKIVFVISEDDARL